MNPHQSAISIFPSVALPKNSRGPKKQIAKKGLLRFCQRILENLGRNNSRWFEKESPGFGIGCGETIMDKYELFDLIHMF